MCILHVFRCQQSETFTKYAGIWETYRVQYSSTEKAQDLEHTQEQLDQLRQESIIITNSANHATAMHTYSK